MFNKKSLMITGGTGSFGKCFILNLLKKYNLKRLVIFSRDEFKQHEQKLFYKSILTKKKFDTLRFYLGDVRDKERLLSASKNIDFLVHAAALKQVPTAETDPLEYIKTNVNGAQNVIEACIENNVKKIIALSTDKAASPINLYGATKLCSDKLFSSANNLIGNKKLIFSIVRYGNVFASRGSVVEVFKKIPEGKMLPITSKDMTRFNISLDKAVEMVIWTFKNMQGGEIFVPKIPSYNILDIAKAMHKKPRLKIIGIRNGEKIHEELITSSDSYNTYDLGKYYSIINPSVSHIQKIYDNKKYKKFPLGKSYNSFNNNDYLKVDQLKKILKKHYY